jgi:hypothetical protein
MTIEFDRGWWRDLANHPKLRHWLASWSMDVCPFDGPRGFLCLGPVVIRLR